MVEINNTKENTHLLRECLQRKDKVAVFVGAGTSKLLGIKGWDNILEEMSEEFCASIDVAKSINEDGYARTATRIYETKNDLIYYKAFMSKQFIPKKAYHYSLHIKLINLFNTFFTTNFDTSFKSAFDDLNKHLAKFNYPITSYQTRYLPEFNYAEILNNPTLVYLHGNYEKNEYIFKEDEYELHYPSCFSKNGYSPLEAFLKDIFKDFVLVFIGFSFNDRIFIEFYKKFRTEAQIFSQDYQRIHGTESSEVKVPKHFIVMSENDLAPIISKNEVITVFDTDPAWEKYFTNSSENDLVFKDNTEDMIREDIKEEVDENKKKKKEFLLGKFSLTRFYLIKKAYLTPITFKNNQYIEIENILNNLFETETMVGNSTDEASTNA